MSVRCATCDSDIVYPAGTWPLGECPVCTRQAEIDCLRERLENVCEKEAYLGRHEALRAEIDRLRAEVERARRVIEAAEAYRTSRHRVLVCHAGEIGPSERDLAGRELDAALREWRDDA